MVLILSNDDVAELLTMEICIAALEEGFREEAAGRAMNQLRYDTSMPLAERPEHEATYEFKTMVGILPALGVAALRMSSTLNHKPIVHGTERSERLYLAPGGGTTGLVQLFSTTTGEALAFVPDGFLQGMRVGATYGLAAKHLAREDATRLGLIGSGWQARFQVAAHQAVRDLELVKVFSPTAEHRERFADEVGEEQDIDIQAVGSLREVSSDVDILVSATNARGAPVVTGDMVRRGMHVAVVTGVELADDARRKADVTAVLSSKQWVTYLGGEGTGQYGGLSRRNRMAVEQHEYPLLNQVITGAARSRTDAEQISVFWSGAGTGVQFASVGARVYELARERGLGDEVPTAWFTQSLHT